MSRLLEKSAILAKAKHEAKAMSEPFKSNFATYVEWILDKIPSVGYPIKNNQVVLCNSCEHEHPCCPATYGDVLFGDGKGHDNICTCSKYKAKQVMPEIVLCQDCKRRGEATKCPMYRVFYNLKNEAGFWEHEMAFKDETKDYGFCSLGEKKDA